jgi:hypothetical protein
MLFHTIAEIRPSDILLWVIELVLAGLGISLAIGFILMLLQPFFALFTGGEISEDSMTLWFWILVAAVLAGLLYWQFS